MLWRFEVLQIVERPIRGYGYAVEGELLNDKRIPRLASRLVGPTRCLQHGYLSPAAGVGAASAAFWLFLLLRP